MGLDDLGKQAVNTYKKWFTSIADKTDVYINDAIDSMGDPFKYNGLTNNLRKSSITRLTDYLNDIQEYKEDSIKRINSAFEKAQKADGDIIDEIRPLYQQALDQVNTSMENVSIYEQQLVGLKNAEKYKEGTKAFNRGFKNTRGEEIIKQEMEIEEIWDKGSKAQQKLYDDMNKHYTRTYHPEIENISKKYFSDQTSAFLNDDALKQYEALKQMAPGMIITEQSYNWETNIDRAHELALRENNQFDFVRQAEEKARGHANNSTSTTAQNQVNTTQNQVNREQKKRRKSYADRTTKPINSEFNNTFYGQYDMQTGTYEYADYKSHYSGGVSRSNYDEEWIWSKQLGDTPDTSEYGIEAPWSTNRTRNTNVPDIPDTPDVPNTPDVPDTSSTPKARKLKNATKSYRPEVKVEGNNIEIDSIYNHSIPKRVNKNNASQPETTVPERSTRRPLTAEEQAAVDRANAQWRADNEARYAEMEKQIENMYNVDDIVFGSPEEILDPNYVSGFDPLEEPIPDIPDNTNTETRRNRTRPQTQNVDIEQQYKDIFNNWETKSGSYNDFINNRTVGPHNIFAPEAAPDINVPKSVNRTLLESEEFINSNPNIKGLSKFDIAMTGVNLLGAVGDYKAARRKGHGVISSAVRAGTQLAIDEALGMWALPVALIKNAPGAMIKGADMLYKENRRMNSAANQQVFGDAQFMDTQQLATMRQSGMEMAKMSQYNLQQTLMGNEATYLHR